jgi:hypothetical protein
MGLNYHNFNKTYFMFEEILEEVKQKLNGLSGEGQEIPSEHADAIQQEIANHIHSSVQSSVNAQAPTESGGILSQLENSLTSGNILTSAVAGGLVGSLGRRFGLSSAVTGAIAASIPGLVEKYMQHKNSETPTAVTPATTT